MPIDPELENLQAEIEDAKAQIAERSAAAGGEGGEGHADAAGDAGAGANTDAAADAAGAGATAAQPNAIETATNGKFKSLEEFDAFLGEVDKLKAGPQYGEEEKKVVDLYKKYGPDAYRYLQVAQTDVTSMSPKDLFIQDFAIKNPNLSMEEVADGWERELKKELGDPALFIDFEDEDSFGQGPYLKGKLQELISDRRKNVSGFYSSMIPNLLKEGQGSGDAGTYNATPVYSDEDKKAFAQEAGAFTKYRPDFVEALGEDGNELEIAVNEIPGFADVAKQIIEDPQAFLEATFMKEKEGGGRALNIQALLNYAASQAGNPLILQKHAQKIGESRYADGLAEGTGKNAEEIRAKLGLMAKDAGKSQDDGLTDDQRKKAAIQAKADEITRKMAGMG